MSKHTDAALIYQSARNTKPILFALILLATVDTSCKKSTDPVADATTFPDILAPGTWQLAVGSQTIDDKLKLLNNTIISFTADGNGTALTSQGGQSSTPGTWVWGGASYYGNPGPNTKTVTFNFGMKAPFNRLSKSWTITNAAKSAIELDSANPAEGEHITMTRQ